MLSSRREFTFFLMNIYLVRHAASFYNTKSFYVQKMSHQDFSSLIEKDLELSLTFSGEKQLDSIVHTFESIHLQKVYSSPAKRALDTAREVAHRFSLQVIVESDLKEVLPHIYCRDTREAYGLWLLLIGYIRLFFPSKSSENFLQAFQRVRRVWSKLMTEPSEETVIVSHDLFLRMLVLYILFTQRDWRIKGVNFRTGGITYLSKRN
jgi:broad specificity phosphatase PhoE